MDKIQCKVKSDEKLNKNKKQWNIAELNDLFYNLKACS